MLGQTSQGEVKIFLKEMSKTFNKFGFFFQQKLKQLKTEKDKELKELTAKYDKREKDRSKQEEKKISALERKIQQLEVAAGAAAGAGAKVGAIFSRVFHHEYIHPGQRIVITYGCHNVNINNI